MADDATPAASTPVTIETTVVEQTVVTESTVPTPATETVIAESPAPPAKVDSPAVATEKTSTAEADASGDATKTAPEAEKKGDVDSATAGEGETAAEESKEELSANGSPNDATVAEDTKNDTSAAPAQTPARKKSVSRRKSMGNLKKTPKKPAEEKSFAPGDLVLTRLKGYPPWPSIVLSEELLPEVMKKGPLGGKRSVGEGMPASAWKTQFPIFFLGSYDYSWAAIADIEALTDELREAGPARKMKNLPEAYELSKDFTLENVKEHLPDPMDIDDDAAEEMDIDEEEEEEEPPSEEEKRPKKRGQKRKSRDSASDDDVSPKPPKTPKTKAAAKTKTPKTKTPKTKTPKTKTPKSAANGVKASAKKAAAKEAATPVKKGGRKRGQKSAEVVEDSTAESAHEDSEDQADKLVDTQNLGDAEKLKVMMGRRHRMQKCLLNKEGIEPSEKEMSIMDRYLESLEAWDPISADLIKTTKIHKVLRNIVKKKEEIPCDAQYSFRTRCKQLHDKWIAVIKEAEEAEPKAADEQELEETQDAEKAEDEDKKEEEKKEESAADEKKEEKEKSETIEERIEAAEKVSIPAADVIKEAAEKNKEGDKEKAEPKEEEAAKA
ncbi:hypothetical protein EX30DRAFT_371061 [Ascodesmis nigricans]|uniref:PWWP domain-containing protein n=1 Tax=Ascodesmis nigricans TaxID=341454 RepID=A0A4S2MZ68_9PEZI|nr:hypothetical protein EX30DRAFT_371061 [Ascodesmis nigricans]